jgi:diguanylate cyclase (GGDEF)-like protein
MKIADTRRTGPALGTGRATATRSVGGVTAGAAQAARGGAVKAAGDVVSVMGIPEVEFTPRVKAAITALMAEVEQLRRELKQSQVRISQLEHLADQDPLVPIPNRRAFVREMSRTMSFVERYNNPACVIYFDINRMKEINDTYGHGAGDAALAMVGQILTAQVRESDFVARLGGDEFGVILSHADETTAGDKAASLAAAVADKPVEWQGQLIPVTVSYGVHAFAGGEDPSQALDAADQAMYARKRSRSTSV